MSISPTDLIGFADKLLNSEQPCETLLRSSMSRAYYGFYHVALAYAEKIGTPPPSAVVGPTHAKLGAFYQTAKQLDKDTQLKMKQVGWSLKALHELRCKADYRLDEHVTKAEAESCFERCVQKIEVVEDLLRARAA